MATHSNFSRHHHHHHHVKHGGFRFSIILILIGLIFLAINTGLIPTIYQPLLSSWPIWVFFVGLYLLTKCSWFSGLTLLTVGTFYLIPQIGEVNPTLNIPANFTHLYWPALLVVAGIYFLLTRFLKPKCWNQYDFHKECSDFQTTSMSDDGFLHISTSFDSRKNIVIDPVFKGGNVECSFGEVVVDLRKTTLQEGNTLLKISVSFGSVQVIVPSDWNVKIQGDSAFGSIHDGRISPSYNPNANSTLVIQSKVSFGDCKLRD